MMPPHDHAICARRAQWAVTAFTVLVTLAAVATGAPLGARVGAPVAALLALAFFTLPLAASAALRRPCPTGAVRLLVLAGSVCLATAAAATGVTAGQLL